jgi:TetR/AcrR family transcriptional regulator, transcriptional repressor for nem operon
MEISPDRERQEKRTSNHTASRILDVAQTLLQSRGYNGFSYRDVAEEVGIQAATIHYYFPTKGDLAAAIVARYRRQLSDRFAAFKRAANSQRHLLELYASLFHATLVDNEQLCLGAMLAAEATTLPPEVLGQTRAFFDDNVAWLTTVFEEAAETGSLMVKGSPLTQARSVVATLEGAMILARAGGDVGIFNNIAETLIAQLQGKTRVETR